MGIRCRRAYIAKLVCVVLRWLESSPSANIPLVISDDVLMCLPAEMGPARSLLPADLSTLFQFPVCEPL